MESLHIVVMGVAGSGKTTVAAALADRLGWVLAEADEFHPPANIAKMASGVPLTDEDRWPWLRSIRDWMTEQARGGRSTVLTCSALKHTYRELLAEAEGRVVFAHLDGSPELLAERMSGRSGHFMPTTLLPSQLATLEPLTEGELASGSLRLDIAGSPEAIADEIIGSLGITDA
ncbi:gluconokinase [Sinomonas sp. ASV322]|uniref:gluconokinase n=1 Tax=Sinomonas sp. ASV322 TaxID=3041920 RepID=UPI0027DC8300|nr:gluconokinase [Sinomonas sp. ASV322]MDQ4502882.1 gluconokinase [Sinomonas sp. ASV322]